MKKWIRWQGIIPFVCIMGLLALFWFAFLDIIVEWGIESAATKAVGARVEIDKTDVSLFPAGINIYRLQVTNPDEPMTNAVEIAKMGFTMDSHALLRKKVIVDQIVMDGLRLNTPRKSSGAIKKRGRDDKEKKVDLEKFRKSVEKAGCVSLELPSLETPDIKNVLELDNLGSLKIIQQFKNKMDTEKKQLEESLNKLPNKKTFARYKKRIEKLQNSKSSIGGFLSGAAEVLDLKKDIETDINRLNQEVASYNKMMSTYKNRLSQVKEAPQQEIRRLADKYALSPKGLSRMGQMLLGPKFCGWWKKGYYWYARVKPYIRQPAGKKDEPELVEPIRGKGINVKFAEHHPLPDFLIRLTRANVILEAGELTGVIENISTEQHVIGKPITLKFSGKNMKGLKAFNAMGEMNHIRPENPKYTMDMKIKAYQLRNLVLSESKTFPLTIDEARTDLDMTFTLSGSKLSARLNSVLATVKMAPIAGENSSTLAKAMSSALSGIRKFSVRVRADGTIEDYHIDIKSDLDKILKSAVGNLIKKEARKFTARLEKEVMGKVGGSMGEANQSFNALGPVGDELTNRLNLGNNLLKSDLFKGAKLPF